MLAEDIGGWLAAGMLLLASLITSLLALGALFPAYRGNRKLTVRLITPAAVTALLAVWYFADAYFHREFHNEEEIMENYIQPWLFMGLPPLATSLLAGSVLWFRKHNQSPDN